MSRWDRFFYIAGNVLVAAMIGIVLFGVVGLALHYTGHWPDGPTLRTCSIGAH